MSIQPDHQLGLMLSPALLVPQANVIWAPLTLSTSMRNKLWRMRQPPPNDRILRKSLRNG